MFNPDANLFIWSCKHGSEDTNALLLATASDYILSFETNKIPHPRQLFGHMQNGNSATIIRM